jgi:DNA helicase-2/ATP-dependent DNA helicase PcrA
VSQQAERAIHRILAGPGSGKTRRLIQELNTQLTNGLPATAILGITFTRRAADELKQRLQTRGSATALPWLGTIHALARRILADCRQLPDELNLDRLIPDATAALTAGTIPSWIPTLRFIGVDEAQDLDGTQVNFLDAMLTISPQAELFLVGDPDQAIYGFRRASSAFLLHPEDYFPGRVRTMVLSDNHRSAQQIVKLAQSILASTADADSPSQSLKAMRPEAHPAVRELVGQSPEDESRLIFQEIRTLMAVQVPAEQQAILCRTRAQFAALKAEAARWDIPLHMPPTDDRLGPPSATPPVQQGVALLTIHQSKGCEWTVVYLAGCQTGLMPFSAAKTPHEQREERRLLYVAVTRAKQLLWISRHGTRTAYLPIAAPAASVIASVQPPRRSFRGWLQFCLTGRSTAKTA